MNRDFVCIICPNGCEICVEMALDGTVAKMQGQLCKRGEEYVRQEITDPRRNIATSVVLHGGTLPVVSVRLTASVPKACIFDVMAQINNQSLQAPVVIGQVVIANVLGLGADVIVTKQVGKR